MFKSKDVSVLEPFLSLEQLEWADIIRFREDVLALGDVPEAFDSLQRLQRLLENLPGKALVLWGTSHCFSIERCNALLKDLGDVHERSVVGTCLPSSLCGVTMVREENVFAGLIPWLRSLKRPVIMVFQGDVSLPFLGLGLACDYRVADSNTTFYNQGRHFDMPPGAGLLYLLPAYIGLGRANSLVTRTTELPAHAALELGLLDEVAVPSELDQTLQNMAAEVSCFSAETLGTIKQLLNHQLHDFDSYFTMETQGLDKALRGKPWEKLMKGGPEDPSEGSSNGV